MYLVVTVKVKQICLTRGTTEQTRGYKDGRQEPLTVMSCLLHVDKSGTYNQLVTMVDGYEVLIPNWTYNHSTSSID